MRILALGLLLALGPSDYEKRLRALDGDIDPFVIAGVDMSDEALMRSAAPCGVTKECIERQASARKTFDYVWDLFPDSRRAIRRAVLAHTINGVTDWHWAWATYTTQAPPQFRGTFRPFSVTCTLIEGKNTATVRCF